MKKPVLWTASVYLDELLCAISMQIYEHLLHDLPRTTDISNHNDGTF